MISFNIQPDDVVLEIGSGNNPNPRSDILCDRYIYTNHQRAGEFGVVIDRPMVIADGYRLPFKDRAFDYVICSHILEHMENPEAFLKEVARVGKAGYIEVPSAYAERLFGWDFHLWYCTRTKHGIRLQRKSGGERFGGFFHKLIAHHIWFRRWFEKYESYFNIQYEWKRKPVVTIEKKLTPDSEMKPIDEENWNALQDATVSRREDSIFWLQWMTRRIQRKVKKIGRKIGWHIGMQLASGAGVRRVVEYMHCINCKSSLTLSQFTLQCSSCSATYEIDRGMPVMLAQSEIRKGY